MAANAVIPAVANKYNANRNRRKSAMPLPPTILFVYDENAAFIRYLAWLFSVAVRPSCDKRYTKLLNAV